MDLDPRIVARIHALSHASANAKLDAAVMDILKGAQIFEDYIYWGEIPEEEDDANAC